MTPQERADLLAALNEYNGIPKPPGEPSAPGTNGLSDKDRKTATELYEDNLMQKDPSKMTPADREYLRQKVAHLLREENQ